MKIALLVFTDGRNDYLNRTLDSAEANLQCEFAIKAIINDNPEVIPEYRQGYYVVGDFKRLGYCESIRKAWAGLPADIDYVFHLEDDFTFNEPIPVMDMIEVLKAKPTLAQMALLRQAVNGEEQAAGGILQAHPERFIERNAGRYTWLESNFCFTQNPCVYPIAITKMRYPDPPNGEGKFSALLREAGYVFGYWGGMDQKPKVAHIGERRAPGGFY